MQVGQGEGWGVGKVPVELGGHQGEQSAEKKKNQQRQREGARETG